MAINRLIKEGDSKSRAIEILFIAHSMTPGVLLTRKRMNNEYARDPLITNHYTLT